MALSCSCGDVYDWYYEISDYDTRYHAVSAEECYGCGEPIQIGDEIGRISSHEYDEGGDEISHKDIGSMCSTCLDMEVNYRELGFFLEPSPGFISEARRDYMKLLPLKHIIRSAT